MGKSILSEDSVIEIGKGTPLSNYRDFFENATGEKMPGAEFQPWLNLQAGKTIKDALCEYLSASERKPMRKLLDEARFDCITAADKAFILAFDEAIAPLGYDFGGGIGDGYCWGKYMVIYSQTGAKSKKVIARIFIKDSGIVLRLFFNNVDKHAEYIENAPPHIKEVFTGSRGDCSCNPKKENCRMRKAYAIDGRQFEKCSGVVFEFRNPTAERNADYIGLLREFYPLKKTKS